jgi:pentapeptide MXKDX repeat protein
MLIAVCCAALVGGVSMASAQTTAPAPQDSMKTNSPMDSHAAMKKKHKMKKSMTKPDDTSKTDTSKGDMSKDTMKKDSK